MAGTAPHRLVTTSTVIDWADGDPERTEWIVDSPVTASEIGATSTPTTKP